VNETTGISPLVTRPVKSSLTSRLTAVGSKPANHFYRSTHSLRHQIHVRSCSDSRRTAALQRTETAGFQASERKATFTRAGVLKMFKRAAEAAALPFPIHPHMQRASKRRMTARLRGPCSTYSAIRIVRFSDSNRIGSHHWFGGCAVGFSALGPDGQHAMWTLGTSGHSL
jgi:hypothetical protein